MTDEARDAIEVEFPPLYEKQRAAFYAPERYVWIEGATKSGKTHGCLHWSLYHAFQDSPGEQSAWVAPVGSQAKMALDRAARYLPEPLRVVNLSERFIEIRGAGRLWFKGSDRPDSIYGEDYKRVSVDEATRMKESAWDAVRSTLTATQGPARLMANVRGRSNFHYKGCRAAAGKTGHKYVKLTCWDAVDAGVVPRSEIEDARQAFADRPHVFRQLYECEPADDGGNPFGLDAIARQTMDEFAPGPAVVWGWDLAKSMDWTFGVGLNAEGQTCELHRFQRDWRDTVQTMLKIVGDVPALVDSTGVGDPVLEELQAATGRRVQVASDRVEYRDTPFQGFKFSSSSKQQLMEGLAIGLQSGKVAHVGGVLRDELEAFEYEYTRSGVRYSAPEGMHDDGVCAYALAWRHFEDQARNRVEPQSAIVVPTGRRRYKLNF